MCVYVCMRVHLECRCRCHAGSMSACDCTCLCMCVCACVYACVRTCMCARMCVRVQGCQQCQQDSTAPPPPHLHYQHAHLRHCLLLGLKHLPIGTGHTLSATMCAMLTDGAAYGRVHIVSHSFRNSVWNAQKPSSRSRAHRVSAMQQQNPFTHCQPQ